MNASPADALPELRADQRAIAGHPARFKVLACGRRWGKTTLGLKLAVEAAERGERAWWVAPTYGLAFEPWRMLKRALADRWEAKLESARHIDLPGGGSLTVQSADDPDSLRGVGLNLVVVDEAAFVAEEAWTAALRPALADRRGRALIVSTPRGRNWFWHAFQRGRDPLNRAWEAWQFATGDNPGIDRDEIDEARASLPERVFQQEYLAAFLEDGGTVFRRVRQAATAPPDAVPRPGGRYVMGVDFGRYDDFTAAAVLDAETGALTALDRFREAGWDLQRARLAGLAHRWGVEAILAEANAMGEPNIEALRREAGLPVIAFVTSALSKPPLIEGLVRAIESAEIALLPDETLLAELEAYTYRSTRYSTYYSAPPGRHDDTVIALALAWKLATTPRLALGMAEV